MKIAVCGHEKLFHEQLLAHLNRYFAGTDVRIECFGSGEAFLRAYRAQSVPFDLVFLDFEMPHRNGLDIAKALRARDRDVRIIFLTCHAECAADGYEVGAFRFLMKPIDEQKLFRALQDVQRTMRRDKRIIIRTTEKDVLLRLTDIVYAEAQNVNLRLRTADAAYVIRHTLRQMEVDLQGPVFFKPHRSYVLNLEYVKDYSSKAVTMTTGDILPLSRGKYQALQEALLLYIKSCGK